MRKRFIAGCISLFVLLLTASALFAATLPQKLPTRSLRSADDGPMIDMGRVEAAERIEDALVSIPLGEGAQAELDALLIDLQDPHSSSYHQWLTPEQFGERFGPSEKDVAALTAAMRAHGLVPTAVARSRRWVRFSGTAGNVEKAFAAQIHKIQNASTTRLRFAQPLSPRTLGGIRAQVFLPDDLRLKSSARKVTPSFNASTGIHALAPGDWTTIYNVAPLYAAGLRGSASDGSNICVVGQSEIDVSDTQMFRNYVGLAANDPTIVNVGVSPGHTDDQVEGDLDVQWTGAIAPQAKIRYYVAKAAGSAAAQAVDDNYCSIISVSYGSCEGTATSGLASAYDGLWQQAVAQGISVFVSSGDSGASGCDAMSATTGSGVSVNVICTPSTTCVGGTSFDDTSSPGTYWLPAHDSTTKTSARSYIPEVAWNEPAYGLAASGGGVSTFFARPSWQVASGVPGGSMRCEPDIAAAAAGHVPYLVITGGTLNGILGTSAATPSLAAVFGLLMQKNGRLGNVNSTLYKLGRAQYSSGGAAVFHDVTSGNNSVTGVTGFNCGTAYDLVTGLGSINAGTLLTAWSSSTPTGFVCSPNTTTACMMNNRFQVKVRYRGVFDNNAADTDALVKPVTGFGSASYETGFFYFNSSNNIEILVKVLDQGVPSHPYVDVLFGSATPLRTEVTITDSRDGTSKKYTSQFGSQAGQTEFGAFPR
jgi:subtilase family serine protease